MCVQKSHIINTTTRCDYNIYIYINQWKNLGSVIEWFGSLNEKNKYTFICFDIVEFYPSISEDLLKEALSFAKLHTAISQQDTEIIFHSRKSLLKGKPWIKWEGSSLFDVMIESCDGAEVCELVGIYVFNILANKYDKNNTHLTSSRNYLLRSADVSLTSHMIEKSSTKLPPLWRCT